MDSFITGQYFDFDSCNRRHSKSIMSDQLVGHWYLCLSGFKSEVTNIIIKPINDDRNVLYFPRFLKKIPSSQF